MASINVAPDEEEIAVLLDMLFGTFPYITFAKDGLDRNQAAKTFW